MSADKGRPVFVVLGGSGFVGRALCNRLVQQFGGGAALIRVPTRSRVHAQTVQSLPGVEVLPADVHQDADLAQVLQGADAVFNLVAILHGSEAAFEQVHVALPRRLVAACRNAGVKRVLHVSALGVAADAPSRYLRSKARGEALLLESGLNVTVLRPSVIFGAQDKLLNLFAQMQALLPFVPLASAEARFAPVWVEDVAQALANALLADASMGKVYEAAGPQEMTLRQLVQAAGRLSGNPRPVMGLPDGVARLQALFMELLPGPPLMSRDNLDSMRVPNVATGKLPGLRDLGITPMALEAVASGYLGSDQGVARLDAWRAGRR